MYLLALDASRSKKGQHPGRVQMMVLGQAHELTGHLIPPEPNQINGRKGADVHIHLHP